MTRRDEDDFRIKPGRPRSRGTRLKTHELPFVRQALIAARDAGGGARPGGGVAREVGGRFNARGRGAKLMASLPRDSGGWQSGSSGRFRSRRVVVKARVVRLAGKGKSARVPKMRGALSVGAVGAHLRYLERDGVTRDGEKGRAYSAFGDEIDARAFVERSQDDRHQFRLIVAPEDATELGDLKRFTRDLMRHMENDLGTRLDWIAVDHHNTGHPHSHILVRGVLDDGRILNIAGDYIAHGIRHRASELMTLELGPQTEVELQNKLRHEVDADRLTRLDRMMIAEQREHGILDLRPDAGESYLVRTSRLVLIDRIKRLESFGVAEEIEPGRWSIAERAESTLRAMGEREDILRTMYRALADHGLADERGAAQYVTHGNRISHALVGRVLDKGLAGDEMGERVYLVIDGVDGRTHHVETSDASRLEDIKRGHIIALDPLPTKSDPRPADLNIATMAEANNGIYRPSEHLEAARPAIEQQRGDPDAFIRAHVRRLESLRRAGHVERIDADHWKIPEDLPERGIAHDARTARKDFGVRTLLAFDLDQQVGSDGSTWLDRELASRQRTELSDVGFGREVGEALERRRQSLVDQGHAVRLENGTVRAPRDILARLEAVEVDRVGRAMAAERGLAYTPSQPGEYVSGRLAGSVNLVSGRFAMIDNGLGFQLVPWQPVLEKQIGRHISGVSRDGGVEWRLGRNRGLGL
ncbi:UNVERIFIED_ORG: type IV secretory pathway VirD2 relaxase [Xanthobacter viscosus]|uniref:DUF3363 domain-containing protein n=1 Tax=Xanthobacter autotrophicus TaxID=280 RepID=A0A6C1KJA6_XANAU|nr:DUF3363 domain-containing protein [Xanthobacter autotrophicus]TLX43911.1 DUF3363 domain-containing protein [Xanthobacter autotrophicus]